MIVFLKKKDRGNRFKEKNKEKERKDKKKINMAYGIINSISAMGGGNVSNTLTGSYGIAGIVVMWDDDQPDGGGSVLVPICKYFATPVRIVLGEGSPSCFLVNVDANGNVTISIGSKTYGNPKVKFVISL